MADASQSVSSANAGVVIRRVMRETPTNEIEPTVAVEQLRKVPNGASSVYQQDILLHTAQRLIHGRSHARKRKHG